MDKIRIKRYVIMGKKFEKVMKEFSQHKLRSGSGVLVVNPKQAVAIAYSEERKQKIKR